MYTTIEIKPSDTLDVCRNLRPVATDCGTSLSPVGNPDVVASIPSSATLLITYRHSDGCRTLFYADGSRLLALVGDDDPIEIATLPSAPLCAAAGRDCIAISTHLGSYFVNYEDGAWMPTGLIAGIPHIFFTATELREFSASTDALTLSGSYSRWSGALDSADREMITADLLSLYSQVAADANAAGYFIQPVVVRYRLFDAEGAVLYTSSPVMVSPDGFQAIDPITAEVTDRAVIEPYSLSVRGYRLRLSVDSLLESEWASRVASMQISISPQLHAVDYSAAADYRLQAATAGDTILLYLPGTSQGLISSADSRRDMVRAAVEHIDTEPRRIVVAYPFVGGINGVEPIRPISSLSPRQDAAQLRKALAAAPEVVPVPPLFSFRQAHAVGDMLIYGDILMHRRSPHPLSEFTASYESAPWRGCVAVTMADGSEQVVWSGQALDYAPLSLSPLLTYPSADARSLYVSILYADGTHRVATFPLTPSSVADMACYIDPTLAPIELPISQESYYVPAATAAAKVYRGRVMAASITTPVIPFASIDATPGTVTAITSAVRSSSSWDFGRAHLYLFSTAGIYSLAVTRARALASCQLLDRRPVLSSQAVTSTPDGVIVIAGSDLVRVSASRVATLLRGVDYHAVCYNSAFDELLCIPSDGSLLVRRLDTDYCYRRSIVPLRFYDDAKAHCLTADGSLLDMSTEQPAATVDIAWSHRRCLASSPRRVGRVVLASWRLYGTGVDLRLSLRGDRGGNTSLALATLDVAGEVNASVPARVIAPPRSHITATIAGTVSSDFTFPALQLLMQDNGRI